MLRIFSLGRGRCVKPVLAYDEGRTTEDVETYDRKRLTANHFFLQFPAHTIQHSIDELDRFRA